MTKPNYTAIFVLVAALVTTACSTVFASTSKPNVVIMSPPSNSQFHTGDIVSVQSTSTDPADVISVELSVDGIVVNSTPSPTPQVSFTVVQPWTATTPGTHIVTVSAVNSANVVSQPASIQVLVLPAVNMPIPPPSPTPSLTSTPVPGSACVNNSAFVADVSIPDGMTLAPGQTFSKIWRVRNTGTCTWSLGDLLVFTGGVAMTPTTAVPVPATAPGSTADLVVPMTAPTTAATITGLWRMANANGTPFGPTFNVTIRVAAAPSVSCPFTPFIASFSALPTTITSGQAATLSWGLVTGAQQAEIDNGIGGVATPGNTTVRPTTTTTYTLTATCASKVRTAQVTITVVGPSPTPSPVPTNSPTPTRTPTP